MERRLIESIASKLEKLPGAEITVEYAVTNSEGKRRVVDIVLLWEQRFFVIEVKAYNIGAIRSARADEWVLRDKPISNHFFSPLRQARDYYYAIRPMFMNYGDGGAFVALPMISRVNWNKIEATDNITEQLLFKDELEDPNKISAKILNRKTATPKPLPVSMGEAEESFKIFISYRRSDSRWAAGRLADALKQEFGDDNVFFDTHDIHGGQAFRERIEETIAQSSVLIVVMGETWLTVSHQDSGKRRLDDRDDYIRFEYERAVDHNLLIVPVCIDTTPVLQKLHLPRPIKSLADLHRLQLRHEDFANDVRTIIDTINRFKGNPK